ncbi:MoaD/ThiS family protein [Synechococcus sp. Tobar12-5m-g]|uniref:MoaD/ThiS family protein n=1 Tax=unclassified Synechococcus TaxID=2626047 RepID=UPI0020CD53BD|nr:MULTISPECIES: MoaD/ThiS family protein [unclassified Synechococcus]MCP9773817.1 MoaD/ThiS family protein [Synechococcus sp. Tobar12-5m-g]MCP9874803.1 MoaD/ThiS family protein [Synechococcus sp. Cruz CV-v-12]
MPCPEAPGLITVRLFAGLRERAGWSERAVAIGTGQPRPTAADLWCRLGLGDGTGKPEGSLPGALRIAINQTFAHADQELEAGDELAFLPPISGG